MERAKEKLGANPRINSDPRQRRFAPLSRARYAERYAI